MNIGAPDTTSNNTNPKNKGLAYTPSAEPPAPQGNLEPAVNLVQTALANSQQKTQETIEQINQNVVAQMEQNTIDKTFNAETAQTAVKEQNTIAQEALTLQSEAVAKNIETLTKAQEDLDKLSEVAAKNPHNKALQEQLAKAQENVAQKLQESENFVNDSARAREALKNLNAGSELSSSLADSNTQDQGKAAKDIKANGLVVKSEEYSAPSLSKENSDDGSLEMGAPGKKKLKAKTALQLALEKRLQELSTLQNKSPEQKAQDTVASIGWFKSGEEKDKDEAEYVSKKKLMRFSDQEIAETRDLIMGVGGKSGRNLASLDRLKADGVEGPEGRSLFTRIHEKIKISSKDKLEI